MKEGQVRRPPEPPAGSPGLFVSSVKCAGESQARVGDGRSIRAAGGAEIIRFSEHTLHGDADLVQRSAAECASLPSARGHGVGGGRGFFIVGGKKEMTATFARNDRPRGPRELFQCFLDMAAHRGLPAGHAALTMRLDS